MTGEGDGRRAFALPGAVPQYGPDKTVDVLHIDLHLVPDLDAQRLAGVCTTTFRALDEPVDQLRLDAVDMQIVGVRDEEGEELAFRSTSTALTVTFEPPVAPGERCIISVAYVVDRPRRGLYFIAPTSREPDKPRQAWTQSQDQDARFWFPCLDYPHEKQTTSATIVVPRGLFALGNGALVERRDEGDRTLFRYEQRVPHATYLMTMVAGEFSEIAQAHPRVPVFYYVAPGREADGERSFGKTPQMLQTFERTLGVPYPFARYSQIAVADFTFGGMENTSATTQTDRTLHDERAHLDFSSDFLVAHELAHQWFGDLLTTRDWSHAWLNEGFATYFEAVFREADLGWDEYLYDVFGMVKAYLGEDADRYRRPIVCNRFVEPIELFDRHLYEKGAAVLHMLRGELGWERLCRVFAHYLRAHAQTSVETIDLIRAIEVTTGRNLREFFDRWVFRGGHPALKVAYRYDAKRGAAVVDVSQTQHVDDEHPAYAFDLTLGFTFEHAPPLRRDAGEAPLPDELRRRVTVSRANESFVVPVEREPWLLRVDPGAYVLSSLEYGFEDELLARILAHEPDVVARIRAAQALGKSETAFARRALAAALGAEPFWGVAVEVAAVLGERREDGAKRALLEALAHPHPKVRRAVASALGKYRGDEVAAALLGMRADVSYFVSAAALQSLGCTRDPRAYDALVAALDEPSWQDTIASAGCAGLAELADPRAIEPLRRVACDAPREPLRRAAIAALARAATLLERERATVVDTLERLSDDEALFVRLSLVAAAQTLADARLVPMLERFATLGPPALRRPALEAAARVREAQSVPAEVTQLRADLDRLREEQRALRERIEIIAPA